MMTLFDAIEGGRYIVKMVKSEDEILKERLKSFGIIKGCKVEILNISTKKSTIAILVKNSKVALRDSEAKIIDIESIA